MPFRKNKNKRKKQYINLERIRRKETRIENQSLRELFYDKIFQTNHPNPTIIYLFGDPGVLVE